MDEDEVMYPRSTVELGKLLSNVGILDRENAAICGVSIRAIRHWRSGDRRGNQLRPKSSSAPMCPRCDRRALNHEAYPYLLCLYLRHCHITPQRTNAVPCLV